MLPLKTIFAKKIQFEKFIFQTVNRKAAKSKTIRYLAVRELILKKLSQSLLLE